MIRQNDLYVKVAARIHIQPCAGIPDGPPLRGPPGNGGCRRTKTGTAGYVYMEEITKKGRFL
jgi:hypothetical protein